MPVQTIKAFAAFALFSCLSLATMLGCVQTKNIQVAPIIETETLVSAAPTVAKQAAIATEPPPKKAIVKEEAAAQNFQGRYDIFNRERISEGSKHESQYYWRSFAISEDHKIMAKTTADNPHKATNQSLYVLANKPLSYKLWALFSK